MRDASEALDPVEGVAGVRALPALEHRLGSDPVLLFSQGEISRKQAMRIMDIAYGDLLDRIADRGLPLPRVSDAEADRMADMFVTLLDQHAR